MAICPICKEPGEGDAEFCAVHGARLIRESGAPTRPTPPAETSSADSKRNISSTDESAADELRAMRAELARRNVRIAELEAELANAGRDDDEEAAESGDADEEPADKDTRSDSTDSSLEETEFVPPAPRTFGWLIGVGGVVAGQRYAIGPNRIDIGRLKKFADGGIRINHKNVSNPHAFITVENDTVTLHDEGSTNGTFVGDKKTERITKVPLRNGETVIFAERGVAEFVFKQS